jgi:hypothetical protein
MPSENNQEQPMFELAGMRDVEVDAVRAFAPLLKKLQHSAPMVFLPRCSLLAVSETLQTTLSSGSLQSPIRFCSMSSA